jgi:hypothetical protein
MDLEELAMTAAQLGRYRFLLTSSPLPDEEQDETSSTAQTRKPVGTW